MIMINCKTNRVTFELAGKKKVASGKPWTFSAKNIKDVDVLVLLV